MPPAATRASDWSTATLSPTATCSSATSPSIGAVSTSSIFIDSSTTTGSPARDRSPTRAPGRAAPARASARARRRRARRPARPRAACRADAATPSRRAPIQITSPSRRVVPLAAFAADRRPRSARAGPLRVMPSGVAGPRPRAASPGPTLSRHHELARRTAQSPAVDAARTGRRRCARVRRCERDHRGGERHARRPAARRRAAAARSISPVSSRPARTSSVVEQLAQEAGVGRDAEHRRSAPRARSSSASAVARSAPWAITLAIIGS